MTPRNRDESIAYCATLSLGGLTGWSLPTLIEWESLIQFPAQSQASINTTAFPNAFGEKYWTSTAQVGVANSGWLMDTQMTTGAAQAQPVADQHYARCVWAPQRVIPPQHYSVAGEEVTDNYTGLVWQRTSTDSTHSNGDAGGVCTLPWRVPSRRELETLVDFRRSSPAIDPTAFSALPAGDGTYPACSASGPWTVLFLYGASWDSASQPCSVRCVK